MLAVKPMSSEIEAISTNLYFTGHRNHCSIQACLLLSLLKTLPSFITNCTFSSALMSCSGIAVDRDHVGKGSRSNHADLSLHVEHRSRPRGCALNSVHRLHAELHHARELLRDGLGPGNSAHVGAEDDLHSRLERFLERRFMHRSAQPVALSGWRVRGSPIVCSRH